MDRKVCENAGIKILGKADPGGSEFGLLKGYGSTFGNWDRTAERPIKGAFAPYLAEFKRDGFISAYHNWTTIPVATITDVDEDDIGLPFVAEFHSTAAAQDIRTTLAERLARGKSVKTSIGYDVLADEFVEREDGTPGRLLKEIYLYEIAVVNVPANPLADVTGIKAGLPAGLKFDAESEMVLATVQDYLKRAQIIKGLRTKEGRVLSAANRNRLADLRTSLLVDDVQPHRPCSSLDGPDRRVEVRGVEIGKLLLRDVADLLPGDLPDLLLVGHARALLDPGGLLEEHGRRRRLGDERERAVVEDRDHDRDDEIPLLLGAGVELLAEHHDVHAVLPERGADRRRGVGLARGNLKLDERLNLLHCLKPSRPDRNPARPASRDRRSTRAPGPSASPASLLRPSPRSWRTDRRSRAPSHPLRSERGASA